MRRALGIAIVLLALAGLRTWRSVHVEEAQRVQVTHRLISTGWGLPPARQVRPVGLAAIWIGHQWFAPPDGADGLRAAATTLDGELVDYFDYDLSRVPAVRRFGAHCRRRPVGTVLSLALRGSLRNEDPQARESLAHTLEELGARAAPLDLETASWALVTRRTRAGWKRLGEAYSPVRGVVLTLPNLTLDEPIELIERDAPSAVSWVSRLRARREEDGVRFGWPLLHGTSDGLRWGFGPRAESQTHRLEVELGTRPRFVCTLATMPAEQEGRADFVLSVDGAPFARRTLSAAGGPASEFWEVPLEGLDGERVRLELAAEGHGVLWGAATSPLVLFD